MPLPNPMFAHTHGQLDLPCAIGAVFLQLRRRLGVLNSQPMFIPSCIACQVCHLLSTALLLSNQHRE